MRTRTCPKTLSGDRSQRGAPECVRGHQDLLGHPDWQYVCDELRRLGKKLFHSVFRRSIVTELEAVIFGVFQGFLIFDGPISLLANPRAVAENITVADRKDGAPALREEVRAQEGAA